MVAALIERELRRRMSEEKIKSIPIYPEERECKAPTSPRVFELFAQVDWFRHIGREEQTTYSVNLSDLQREILRLLRVPRKLFEATCGE